MFNIVLNFYIFLSKRNKILLYIYLKHAIHIPSSYIIPINPYFLYISFLALYIVQIQGWVKVFYSQLGIPSIPINCLS